MASEFEVGVEWHYPLDELYYGLVRIQDRIPFADPYLSDYVFFKSLILGDESFEHRTVDLFEAFVLTGYLPCEHENLALEIDELLHDLISEEAFYETVEAFDEEHGEGFSAIALEQDIKNEKNLTEFELICLEDSFYEWLAQNECEKRGELVTEFERKAELTNYTFVVPVYEDFGRMTSLKLINRPFEGVW